MKWIKVVGRFLSSLVRFFAERMAWCCVMLCMAVLALFSPALVQEITDEFRLEDLE